MSENFDAVPLVLFKTRTNSELGAQTITIDESDGSIVFHDVLKKVTEAMLTSYPRTQLGCWTPNRASIRFSRDEIAERDVRKFDGGDKLDADAIAALAS
jgi:hypothetical protein